MVISVKDLAPAAYTSGDGEVVRAAIVAALARTDDVVVSFAGVDGVTSSFVNSAFVPLLEAIGFDEFKKQIRIVEATKPTLELIRHRLNFEAKRLSVA